MNDDYCPATAGLMRTHGDHLIACEYSLILCYFSFFCPFSLLFEMIKYIQFVFVFYYSAAIK